VSAFTHDTVINVLFNNGMPLHTVYPFRGNAHSAKLKDTSVVFDISINDKNIVYFNLIKQRLKQFGNIPVTDPKWVKKLPPWIVDILTKSLYDYITAWSEYYYTQLPEIVKLPRSKIAAAIATNGGVQELQPITYEKQIWLLYVTQEDKRSMVEYVEDLFKRLQPWLDIKLWSEQERKKANQKVNTGNLEDVRKQMIDGSFGKKELEEFKKQTEGDMKPPAVQEELDLDTVE